MERIGIEPMTSWLQSTHGQHHSPTTCRLSLSNRNRLLARGTDQSWELLGFHVPKTSQASPRVRTLASLTKCGRDIALLVAAGLKDKEIAKRLGRSANTVDKHLKEIAERWQLTDRSC